MSGRPRRKPSARRAGCGSPDLAKSRVLRFQHRPAERPRRGQAEIKDAKTPGFELGPDRGGAGEDVGELDPVEEPVPALISQVAERDPGEKPPEGFPRAAGMAPVRDKELAEKIAAGLERAADAAEDLDPQAARRDRGIAAARGQPGQVIGRPG